MAGTASLNDALRRVYLWHSTEAQLHNVRTGLVLPPARTNEQAMKLIRKELAAQKEAPSRSASPL